MRPIPPPTRLIRTTDPITGERQELYDYRGSQHLPKRPRELECDFCGQDARRLWCRMVRPFGAVTAEKPDGSTLKFCYDGGTWNACDVCRPLVTARDFAGTARRAAAGLGADDDYCRRLHSVVFLCTEDAPERVWLSGDEFPLRERGSEGVTVTGPLR